MPPRLPSRQQRPRQQNISVYTKGTTTINVCSMRYMSELIEAGTRSGDRGVIGIQNTETAAANPRRRRRYNEGKELLHPQSKPYCEDYLESYPATSGISAFETLVLFQNSLQKSSYMILLLMGPHRGASRCVLKSENRPCFFPSLSTTSFLSSSGLLHISLLLLLSPKVSFLLISPGAKMARFFCCGKGLHVIELERAEISAFRRSEAIGDGPEERDGTVPRPFRPFWKQKEKKKKT
ncbi:hypothetical protein AVEN_255096-1 [Araneus ventricosus]|uniref:Uncharacterized protein n=1 Tax=Araneus ventricosus TaxID=182803 RepID=A0A4Y2EDM2_ARAVE|nr:hypothetical protein AVEN_255096-1 [Araneus ventricosus]